MSGFRQSSSANDIDPISVGLLQVRERIVLDGNGFSGAPNRIRFAVQMISSVSKLFGYDLYVDSRSALIAELDRRIADRSSASIVSLNTLKLYQGSKSSDLQKLFQSADYVIPDGQSIVIAERLINRNEISAISGAELMVELIRHSAFRGYRLFFLGSPKSLLDRVQQKILVDYPELGDKIGFQHGYYDQRDEEQMVIDMICDFRPDILFVAFGSPRKEEFIVKNKESLGVISMGVGGSFEYFVGDVKLDGLTKRLGIRWLVRTIQDPGRLAKRYALCNTYFLSALIQEWWNRRILGNN